MSLADITRDAVLKAIAEYDELGQDVFLDTYGFEPARSYKLLHEDREYDSKAICGVAHKHVSGHVLRASDFSGGEATVGKKLRSLGFNVRSGRSPNWAWDELVLACDLLAKHGWKTLDTSRSEVVALSELLQLLPLHPPEERPPDFRSPASVRLKMANILNWHPSRTTKRTNGGALDRRVVEEFLEDPQRMHAAAESIRTGTLSGELADLPVFEEEEADEEISAPEGRLLVRKHYARERNRKLRTQKIARTRAQGLPVACEACGFDFARTYGARGADYIEVHHVVPLHHIGESRTRLQDLALLCANCHRMIHVSKPWLTVDQLRTLIREQHQPRV
ncbi:HNH endonuclease [Nocardiopsis sp. EMB25]|uniref:HNH endonuclease n=1 Tax=Nocardiopsis sp. EMB25 TaxID=2835867 RepID=UPI002284D5D0|nr:HNH endonuclease [Nocardiopsis sp. EMB25]MCY9786685.1 HNH endonuclease [Nocardiopsis sp. EMB25]